LFIRSWGRWGKQKQIERIVFVLIEPKKAIAVSVNQGLPGFKWAIVREKADVVAYLRSIGAPE